MKLLAFFLLIFSTSVFADYEMSRTDAVKTIRTLKQSNIASVAAMGTRFLSITKVVCAAKDGNVSCRATERFTGKRKVLKNPTFFFRLLYKAGFDSFKAGAIECEFDDEETVIDDASCTIEN